MEKAKVYFTDMRTGNRTSLPEKLREAMVLRHMENLSYEQIAEYLNCKVGTVKSRLARGREILRRELARLDGMKNKQEADGRTP